MCDKNRSFIERRYSQQQQKKFKGSKCISVQINEKYLQAIQNKKFDTRLAQRQSNGGPEQEISGKFVSNFLTFLRKPSKTNNFIE